MRKKTARKIGRESAGPRLGHAAFLERIGTGGLVIFALMFVIAITAMYAFSPAAALMAGGMPIAFGTTLAANKNRSQKRDAGPLNQFPMIVDIIYEGAAVGDNGSGYARPLEAGDKFLGFAESQVDNSAGSIGDLDVRVHTRNWTVCTISGVLITDIGAPVYASDDDTFSMVATGNSYIGTVHRWVQSNTAEVEFDAASQGDPFGGNEARETHIVDYTVDILDGGKILYMTIDAKTFTLPATVAGLQVTFVNAGGDGLVGVSISPNANDKIQGNDNVAVDDKDLINTKATARRGDFVTLLADGSDGWVITAMKGTWDEE